MFHQDWKPVIIKKKYPTNTKDAKKQGYKVNKEIKKGGNSNSSLYKKTTISKKLDDDEPLKFKKISGSDTFVALW